MKNVEDRLLAGLHDGVVDEGARVLVEYGSLFESDRVSTHDAVEVLEAAVIAPSQYLYYLGVRDLARRLHETGEPVELLYLTKVLERRIEVVVRAHGASLVMIM